MREAARTRDLRRLAEMCHALQHLGAVRIRILVATKATFSRTEESNGITL